MSVAKSSAGREGFHSKKGKYLSVRSGHQTNSSIGGRLNLADRSCRHALRKIGLISFPSSERNAGLGYAEPWKTPFRALPQIRRLNSLRVILGSIEEYISNARSLLLP